MKNSNITAVLCCVLLVGCASTEVAAPIYDRSPKTASGARPAAPTAASSKQSTPPRATAPAESPVPTAPITSSAKPAPPASAAAAPQPSGTAVPHTSRPAPAPTAPAAPVVAAVPQPRAGATEPAIRPYREGDWRPEYYTVKRGDTLYSIALDHGQDYRDLAAWNNLSDPAYIQVDQRLRVFPSGTAGEPVSPEPIALPPATLPSAKPNEPPPATPIPLLAEPKARRLPYSEQALAELTQHGISMLKRSQTSAGSATTNQAPVAAAPRAPVGSSRPVQAGFSGLPDERLTWQWPTTGAVTYGFGEGANYKGIGIHGVTGQPVVASAPGKVVYSGSGLRGYGKLIIIKHNATYLSVYAHNSQLLVKEGQMVAQGQKIAEIGDSDSDRVGLHFEIRRLGKPIDPQKYLPEKAS